MFDSSREYYDLEEVAAGLSEILNEPVTEPIPNSV